MFGQTAFTELMDHKQKLLNDKKQELPDSMGQRDF